MSELSSSPLGIVCNEFWRNTDRNPVDAAAVMSMIHEAVEDFEEAAEPFVSDLISSLDPATNKGLGIQNALLITELAATVRANDAPRVKQWGALSLLGALAMTHDPHTDEHALITDPTVRRTQIAGYVARNELNQVIHSTSIPTEYRNLSRAFIGQQPVSPEDLAIEFELLGLLKKASVESTSTSDETVEAPASTGAEIDPPYTIPLVSLAQGNSEATKKIASMDWLNREWLASSSSVVDVRDIYRDGKKVAKLVDLTGGHHHLKDLKQAAENDPSQGYQLWPQMARAIAHYIETGRAQRISGEKVTTFYASNKARSSESIIRTYYTPLGKDENETQIIGLIATFRTKGNQARVISIISNESGRNISER